MAMVTVFLNDAEVFPLLPLGGLEEVLCLGREYASLGHKVRIERYGSGDGLFENGE
jgi:hypothetical protein